MVNIDSPIIPGKSAGDINLETSIEDVLQQVGEIFEVEHNISSGKGYEGITKYRSKDIDLWVQDGRVWQIVVHGNYSGKVLDTSIGLGSTMTDAKNILGDITLFIENIMVKTLPGISFEPETEDMAARIVEIYVWTPEPDEVRSLTEGT